MGEKGFIDPCGISQRVLALYYGRKDGRPAAKGQLYGCFPGEGYHRMYKYNLFGLNICLPFPCEQLSPSSGHADVEICYGNVPRVGPYDDKGFCQLVSPRRAVFNIEGVGRYLVSEGCRIIIEAEPGGSEKWLRYFLFGVIFGCLLYQRGVLLLHGSAIESEDHAILFVGDPGSGKSTLAAAFEKRGYPLLTEEICVVEGIEEFSPVVRTGYPQLRLWPQVAANLGYGTPSLGEEGGEKEKFTISFGTRSQSATPIKRIYVLSPGDFLEMRKLGVSGADKAAEIIRHTYGHFLIDEMGLTAAHFFKCVSLAAQTELARIVRPSSLSLLNSIVDELEEDFTR
jgi:hypothetical protein